MFKYLWTISSLGRPIARQPFSIFSRNGQVKIQRVRIGKPFFTQKRARNIVLSCAGAILLCNFALEILGEEIEEEEQHEGNKRVKATTQEKQGKDGDEDENLEDAIFIPLGFVHQLPRTYYKRSDPVWQSFLEASKNPPKMNTIRRELARIVIGGVANSHSFQKSLGTPLLKCKYWLDIDFPDGPPPEYARSGMEITADYVAWTTRPVPFGQYLRLQRNLQPLPMLSALWTSCRVLWSLQLEWIQAKLTRDSKRGDLDASSPTALLFLQRFIKAGQHKDQQLNAGNEDYSLELEDDPPEDGPAEGRSEVPLRPGPSSSSEDPSPLRQHMKTALKAFEMTLARKWKQPPALAERGTCLVSGLVQLEGPNAVCVLDVQASYHLQESRWVTCGVALRRMQLRRQVAKGGD